MRQEALFAPAGAVPAIGVGLPAGAGRFVPLLRNRPIGREMVNAAIERGCLRIRSEMAIDLPRCSVRQSVVAEFGADLRARWCIVTSSTATGILRFEAEIQAGQATLRLGAGPGARTVVLDLPHEPLLLPDNCFALHAVSALRIKRSGGAMTPFTSVPAGCDVSLVAPQGSKVLIGGHRFDPASLTLRMDRKVTEQIWIRDGWVERFALPEAQVRIEWVPGGPGEGGIE